MRLNWSEKVAYEALKPVVLEAATGGTKAEPESGKPVLMVVGTRGGVGASTVAINVAGTLARQGKKTILLDLDLQFGSIALTLDIDPGHGLREALDRPERVDSMFLNSSAVKVGENLYVLAAEEGPAGALPAGGSKSRKQASRAASSAGSRRTTSFAGPASVVVRWISFTCTSFTIAPTGAPLGASTSSTMRPAWIESPRAAAQRTRPARTGRRRARSSGLPFGSTWTDVTRSGIAATMRGAVASARKPSYASPVAAEGPPLRSARDNEAMWQGLREGTITTIGSDHAPKENLPDFFESQYGAPHIETIAGAPTGAPGQAKPAVGCVRAGVNRIEVSGVHAHASYLRLYVTLTGQASVYLPCPR